MQRKNIFIYEQTKFYSPLIRKNNFCAPVTVFVTHFFPCFVGLHLRTSNLLHEFLSLLKTSRPTMKAIGSEALFNSVIL